MTIQGALIFKNNLNNLRLKNSYIICRQGVAQVLSKVKTPVGSNIKQGDSKSVCFVTKENGLSFTGQGCFD